jgi:hypothetical protein
VDKELRVTEANVLVGSMEIVVEKRSGDRVPVTVHALNWRTALAVSQMAERDPSLAVIHAVQNALQGEAKSDAFLNSLVPFEITQIANVSMLLSNGVNEAKKRNGPEMTERPAPQPLPTTLPSSVS